jgi:predicted DNA-binding transcriptional regulator YafY
VVKRRWYVIANNPYYADCNRRQNNNFKEIRVYGLDRILKANILDKTFEIKPGFNIDKFYEGCTGVIPSDDDIEHVVLRAYWNAPDYLRTLPLHESQKEIESNDEYALFSYDVKLTYDFLQLIMQQGDQVEVLEPLSLREQMRNLAKTLTHYYKENKENK